MREGWAAQGGQRYAAREEGQWGNSGKRVRKGGHHAGERHYAHLRRRPGGGRGGGGRKGSERKGAFSQGNAATRT